VNDCYGDSNDAGVWYDDDRLDKRSAGAHDKPNPITAGATLNFCWSPAPTAGDVGSLPLVSPDSLT
jgi:hypothetical protein